MGDRKHVHDNATVAYLRGSPQFTPTWGTVAQTGMNLQVRKGSVCVGCGFAQNG
jgi:hypothetical protein